jgi:hypothetical protein
VEVNNLLSANKLPPLGRTSLCLAALKLQPLPLVEHNNKRTNLHLGHLDSVNRLAAIYLAVDSNKLVNLVNKHQQEGCLDNNNSRLHRLAPVLQLLVSNLRINLLEDCLASNKVVQTCLELSQQLLEGQGDSLETLKEA